LAADEPGNMRNALFMTISAILGATACTTYAIIRPCFNSTPMIQAIPRTSYNVR
jgi:hypothetical protein